MLAAECSTQKPRGDQSRGLRERGKEDTAYRFQTAALAAQRYGLAVRTTGGRLDLAGPSGPRPRSKNQYQTWCRHNHR